MKEKVAITICHKDRPENLNILLQSIRISSKENDYEIIVVDNNSSSKESQDFLNKINQFDDIDVVFQDQEFKFTQSLIEGTKHVSEDSEYLIFSHEDNIVLHKTWIDFLIESLLDNPKCGGICAGGALKFTGPNNQLYDGPNYNFLFTPKNIFNSLEGFQFSQCQNVGLFWGYRNQLESIGKNMAIVSHHGFIHHYGEGRISQDDKNEDIKTFNRLILEKARKIHI